MSRQELTRECRRGDHRLKPGPRNPKIQHCENCSYRFPCRDEDCGHLDCMVERGKLGLCHYCRKRVEGPCAAYGWRPCKLTELEHPGGEDASWTCWTIRGKTRTVHYTCRDAHASPAELALWASP